jgi:nucleoside-diphosphate kinase
MIKPDAYTNLGKIIDAIEKNGFTISNIKMTKFTLADAQGKIKQLCIKPSINQYTNFYRILW